MCPGSHHPVTVTRFTRAPAHTTPSHSHTGFTHAPAHTTTSHSRPRLLVTTGHSHPVGSAVPQLTPPRHIDLCSLVSQLTQSQGTPSLSPQSGSVTPMLSHHSPMSPLHDHVTHDEGLQSQEEVIMPQCESRLFTTCSYALRDTRNLNDTRLALQVLYTKC